MAFTLYEIWTVDPDGYQIFADTTSSLNEAKTIGSSYLSETICEIIIFQEISDGLDVLEIIRFKKD